MIKRKKILIIEDDSILSKTMQEFLIDQGYDIVCAGDGEEGISAVKTNHPDLILLDIILPKKDGYEVISDLKQDPATANIPIIILTNLGSLNDVEKAIKLGATTYLVKSDYKMEEIAGKIKGILKG